MYNLSTLIDKDLCFGWSRWREKIERELPRLEKQFNVSLKIISAVQDHNRENIDAPNWKVYAAVPRINSRTLTLSLAQLNAYISK